MNKFLNRRQYNVLVELHQSWIKANWSGLTRQWSLAGVTVSGLTSAQFEYLVSVFNRE